MKKILIGSDLLPSKDIDLDAFNRGDALAIVGKELYDVLCDADFSVYNLETPLANEWTPIAKCGPNLITPTSAIEGYKALKVDAVAIANNHVLDHGYEGFVSTLETLDKAGIKRFGAGLTVEEAKKPLIYDADGFKVGFYVCCEHEFSWIDDYGYGTNGFDPLCTYEEVEEFAKEVDYLVILYHGGKEYYRYPSPNLQRVCQKFIRHGANLVVCQHSHCIGSFEDYKGGKIIYGQGNFIFNRIHNEFWDSGMLVRLTVDNSKVDIDYVVRESEETSIKLSKDEKILADFYARSEKIKDANFIREEYAKFADTKLDEYLVNLANGGDKTLVANMVECEAHRELMLCGLKRKFPKEVEGERFD